MNVDEDINYSLADSIDTIIDMALKSVIFFESIFMRIRKGSQVIVKFDDSSDIAVLVRDLPLESIAIDI